MAEKSIFRIISKLLMVLLVTSVTVFGIYLTHVYTQQQSGLYVTPLIIFCMITLGALLLMFESQRKRFRDFTKAMKELSDDQVSKVNQRVSALLSSQIFPLHGRGQIVEEIAAALERSAERSKLQINTESNSAREVVMFFGAATVLPKGSDMSMLSSNDVESSPFEKYIKANALANDSQVIVERYIRLFDSTNFGGRSSEVRQGYIEWIEAQISNLKKSHNYTIKNARRAPRWKAIRSSFISGDTFIDILGDGESGFSVTGKSFADQQRANAKRYIANSFNREPYISTYNFNNVADLEQHLGEMRDIHIGKSNASAE